MTCYEPGNSKPVCIMSDVLDELQEDGRALKAAQHSTISALAGMRLEMSGVRTELRTTNQKLDRLIDGVRLGNIQAAKPPTPEDIGYDPDEPTLTGREPEVAASIWKERNAASIEREAALQAKLAAALATIEATEAERRRHSERALAQSDRSWSRWQKIGAGILALLTALGGGVGIAKLLGG